VNKMNVKPNIGILNALVRITLGLTFLSWSTAKMVKWPWRDSYFLVAICSAMKVAEGIVRYCPMTAFLQKCQGMTKESDSVSTNTDSKTTDEMVPHNPT
jgi:hypothetical protein